MPFVAYLPMPAVFENENGAYQPAKKIVTECVFRNSFFSLHIFTVNARCWKTISPTSRFAEAALPEIVEAAYRSGRVIVFLQEHSKHAALPFTYYQLYKAAAIRSSCEQGRLFIHVKGAFILNVSSSFVFKVLVLGPRIPARYKHVDWRDYNSVKKAFGLQ